MAQLKDTTINGTLNVVGNITTSQSPTEPNHVPNKEYVDGIGTLYQKDFYPIGNNQTGSGVWNVFTTDSYDITLQKGNYLISYVINATVGGSGMLTSQITNNGEELNINMASRVTSACSTSGWTALNGTFVLTVAEATKYSFKPRIWGNVSWTGHNCRMSIVKLTA